MQIERKNLNLPSDLDSNWIEHCLCFSYTKKESIKKKSYLNYSLIRSPCMKLESVNAPLDSMV